MSLTFSQYKNSRVSRDFSVNYEALCEAIVLNDLDFFEFWSNTILPVLETSQSRDENELLNEFFGLFNKNKPSSSSKQMIQGLNSWQAQKKAAEEERIKALKAKQLEFGRNRVNEMIKTIKSRFILGLRRFIQNAHEEAINKKDPVLWQVINQFYERIARSTETFTVKVSNDGKNQGYKNNFLQLLQSRQGQNSPNPTPQGATETLPENNSYQSKESVNNGNDMLIESLIRCTGNRK